MDEFINDNTHFQQQDETFADGLAKILQANISGYIHSQRIKQQESDRQNRAIMEIRETMKAILEQQKSEHEFLKQSHQQSTERMEEAGRIQQNILKVFSEIQSIRTALNVQEEERIKCQNTQKTLKEQNSKLEQQLVQFQEIHDEWDLYHRFREWQPVHLISLQFPKKDSFMDFISTCSYDGTIEYLFQNVNGNIWKLPEQDIEMVDQMIDFCANLQNRIFDKDKYKRIQTKMDEEYTMDYHQSHSDDPAVGTISKVLLRGIKRDGSVIHKSFVRVK